MAISSPVVSWFNVDRVTPSNSNTMQIAQPYDFGVVDAGYTPTSDDYYSFLIWNNRDERDEDAPQMEEVTIGIKDMNGGNGNEVGSEVWAINGGVSGTDDKWFWAKVDSLNETDSDFAQIGAELAKPIGAGSNSQTEHPNVSVATDWTASKSYSIGDVVNPSVDNGFVYRVLSAGTTGTEEPTWETVEGNETIDGTIVWIAVRKYKQPTDDNIILGGVNHSNPNTNPDWRTKSSGNYSMVTLKCVVPLDSRAGRQDFKLRTSYRFV